MGEVYLNKKPVVEEYEYAYVETSDGAITKVPRNKIYPYVPASEKDVEALSDKLDKEVNQLSEEIADYMKDVDVVMSTNRFNGNLLDGFYITNNGTKTPYADFSCTEKIPCSEGEVIRCSYDNNGIRARATIRFSCFYDENGNVVEGGYNSEISYLDVPQDAKYVVITLKNSMTNSLVIGNIEESDLEYYKYKENTYDYSPSCPKLSKNVEMNTKRIDALEKESNVLVCMGKVNYFNPNDEDIIDKQYMTADGTTTISESFAVTGFIPVSEGDVIEMTYGNPDRNWRGTLRFVTCFNTLKQVIPSLGSDSEAVSFTVPSGVSYVRLTLRKEQMIDVVIGNNLATKDYFPYTEDYGILRSLKKAYAEGYKEVLVKSGTYDVIAEYEDLYGASYFDEYTDYTTTDPFDRGLWLENIKVKFEVGAKVICKYEGSNANVSQYFSAFAAGNNVEIDGLYLDSENLRYGIHPDFNTGVDETYFYVKNSDLRHYKNEQSQQAIGAGLGIHVDWIIENTIFHSEANHIVFRIHNNVSESAKSKVVVRDCYIVGDGYFRFNAYSTSKDITNILVSGCSWKNAPVVEKETSDSYQNIEMVAWNNETR